MVDGAGSPRRPQPGTSGLGLAFLSGLHAACLSAAEFTGRLWGGSFMFLSSEPLNHRCKKTGGNPGPGSLHESSNSQNECVVEPPDKSLALSTLMWGFLHGSAEGA